MKKIFRKIANSFGLTFDKEEREIFGLKEGVIVDVEVKKVSESLRECEYGKEE